MSTFLCFLLCIKLSHTGNIEHEVNYFVKSNFGPMVTFTSHPNRDKLSESLTKLLMKKDDKFASYAKLSKIASMSNENGIGNLVIVNGDAAVLSETILKVIDIAEKRPQRSLLFVHPFHMTEEELKELSNALLFANKSSLFYLSYLNNSNVEWKYIFTLMNVEKVVINSLQFGKFQ